MKQAGDLAPTPLKPYLGVAGSLANLLLAVSESSGALVANYLLIDSDGLSQEMVKAGQAKQRR